MPLGIRRRCSICSSTSTQIWSKNDQDDIICHTCSISSSKPTEENTGKNSENEEKSKSCAIDTDSTANVKASTESCSVDTAPDSSSVKKENGSSVKKNNSDVDYEPMESDNETIDSYESDDVLSEHEDDGVMLFDATKAPSAVATPVTSNSIFHNGYYYQVGDIVSMIDVEGGNYYAQIKGLMQDQYCEKSAAITWLLPTLSSPKDHFDPSTYIIGKLLILLFITL
ncbi:GATA zinc finger domain-containing protein 1 [Nymphon striatum]|nr:GATA zinc finger domain-containing protein 1 [Nymphon striatum]